MNNKRNKKNIWRKYGPRKGWGQGTHFLSMGRDVPTKGVLFSESVWNGERGWCSIVQSLGRDSDIPV